MLEIPADKIQKEKYDTYVEKYIQNIIVINSKNLSSIMFDNFISSRNKRESRIYFELKSKPNRRKPMLMSLKMNNLYLFTAN